MFTLTDAVNAYHDSLNTGAVLDTNARIGARSTPIIGGAWSSLRSGVNYITRWPYAAVGFVVGHREPAAPTMPEIPKAFEGTELGTAFKDSWKLRMEANNAKTEAFAKLVHADITGYQQSSSVASYAETKEHNVTFAEERTSRDSGSVGTGALGGLVAAAAPRIIEVVKTSLG